MIRSKRLVAIAVLALHAPARADDGEPEAPTVEDRLGALEKRVADQTAALVQRDKEIAELRAATEAAALASTPDVSSAKEPTFRLYGFIDMGLQKLWSRDNPALPTRATSFVLGNINLYFDFHPADDWSSLVEVRLTNYPDATTPFGSTVVGDPGNGAGYDTVQWGALVLERAYLQWQRHQQFGVRVGELLTPYGIWNVDHGTPTLISLFRPKFVTNQMWPEHQLGIEAFGRFDDVLPEPWSLEYHAYVSNGRTPGVVDLTDDKMIGGRLVASRIHGHHMAFGLSAMTGDYLAATNEINSMSGESIRVPTVAYRESGIAADASVDLGPWRLRAEATFHHKRYSPDLRGASWLPNIYLPDGNESDVYGLAAYHIPSTRLEPYVFVERYNWPTPLGEGLFIPSIGANYYFTPAIQLKAQYTYSKWDSDGDPDIAPLGMSEHFLAGKLVMGF